MITKIKKEQNIFSDIIKFTKQKEYKAITQLGSGSFGITVLLEDETINEKFVCKKYAPQHNINKEKYYKNFLNEIKLMYKLSHKNIVRVFSYYMYEKIYTGYVLMEYINGLDIQEYLNNNPEMINEVFEQTIEGFAYLESKNILHRDIRPTNILIDKNGFVKIIDFGFGKQAFNDEDFDRSFSSLNWWCPLPLDFQKSIYNFKTEIYFVGKLFEKLISELDINSFNYNEILSKMCELDPNNRIASFDNIKRKLQTNEIFDEIFNDEEISIYQSFARELSDIISAVYDDIKYYNDIELIQKELSDLHRTVMLEDIIPINTAIIKYFLNGAYRYKTNESFRVSVLKNFLNFLKSCSKEKKNIVMSNLHSRFDAIKRIEKQPIYNDDEIPF